MIGMLVIFVGRGFLAVLTATVSSTFVKTERSEETTASPEELRGVRAELAELRARLEPTV
jgi:hypothetical protein